MKQSAQVQTNGPTMKVYPKSREKRTKSNTANEREPKFRVCE